MGGALIEITVDDKEMKALFKRLSARASDMTPVMQIIGETIRSSVIKNFEVGGRPRWKPSAKPKGKTLIDTSRLLGSINWKANKDSVLVGTNVVYAAIHQFGFNGTQTVRAHSRKVKTRDIKEGRRITAKGIGFVRPYERIMNIPARPYLVVQDEDMAEIKAVIRDHIMAAEKGG